VRLVRSGNHLQHEGDVFDGSSEDADAIKRRTVGNQTMAGNTRIRRFEADYAAERRRLAHRTAGIGSQRDTAHAGSDGRRRASGRASGNTCRVYRIQSRPKCGALVGRAHREFVAVLMTYNDRVLVE